MHDLLRDRLLRKLEVLPDEQIYQVLDYIEFLESKYAPGRAPEPSGFQRFAERFEDRMRDMAVAPRYIKGAVGVFGTASKVMNDIVEAGKGVINDVTSVSTPAPAKPPATTPSPPPLLPAEATKPQNESEGE